MNYPVADCFRFAKIEHGGMVARGSDKAQEDAENSAITTSAACLRTAHYQALGSATELFFQFRRLASDHPGYLQSTLLSCAAAICHLPLRFNQVSVQTWHCFASGCVLSLPMACSLP
jgi:hypothetical protein